MSVSVETAYLSSRMNETKLEAQEGKADEHHW